MEPITKKERIRLLKEIRVNNCREIVSCEVNIRVGEMSKLKYPEKMAQIEDFVKGQKMRLEDLAMGVETIDNEIAEATKS